MSHWGILYFGKIKYYYLTVNLILLYLAFESLIRDRVFIQEEKEKEET